MERKSTWRQDFARNKYKYLIFLPVTMYLLLFCYKPMYGAIIAFQKYRPALGILKSQWVGFENFENFFGDFYFARILRNTDIFCKPTSIARFLQHRYGNPTL